MIGVESVRRRAGAPVSPDPRKRAQTQQISVSFWLVDRSGTYHAIDVID